MRREDNEEELTGRKIQGLRAERPRQPDRQTGRQTDLLCTIESGQLVFLLKLLICDFQTHLELQVGLSGDRQTGC